MKDNLRNWSIPIVIVLILFFLKSAYAYDSAFMHRAINEKAVLGSSLDTHLVNQLNLTDGIFTKFENLEIYELLMKGGSEEDFPLTRALNHFHDPLVEWENAGLISQSSLIWAQVDQNENLTPNYSSWKWARDYFREALVTGNEGSFFRMFLALGKIMHLLSDAAVPAHVRSDMHPPPNGDPFEGYFYEDDGDEYSRWLIVNWRQHNYSGLPVDSAIFDNFIQIGPEYDLAPVPISALWDQNKYNGINPETTKYADTALWTIGLAEYTNANFFSEGTILKNYPHPSYEDTDFFNIDWLHPAQVDAEDGKIDNRIYLHGNAGGIDPIRLAAVSYLSYDCLKAGYNEFSTAILDDEIHKEYASKLVPRAIGYSTALLDYFFRGTIEISMPENDVYGLILDPETIIDPTTQGFDLIKVRASNTSPVGEEMTGGSLTFVAKYRVASGDMFVNPPALSTDEFQYVTSTLYNITIPRDTPQEFSFDLTENPIPLWASDVNVYLVYEGWLGNEQDAVAVGYKDISEPTPIDILNATDWACFNGIAYPAGSSAINSAGDLNWDAYEHYLRDIHILFSPQESPLELDGQFTNSTFSINSLAPGVSYRAYVLGDHIINMSSSMGWLDPVAQDDTFFHSGRFSIRISEESLLQNQTSMGTHFYAQFGTTYMGMNYWILNSPYLSYSSDTCDSFFTPVLPSQMFQ